LKLSSQKNSGGVVGVSMAHGILANWKLLSSHLGARNLILNATLQPALQIRGAMSMT
tara:strand:- start:1271 stop:1441 length:171 start_codon:yes stop_codon:yes gene_type:complete